MDAEALNSPSLAAESQRRSSPRAKSLSDSASRPRPSTKFPSDCAFQTELRRRVGAFFNETGRRPRDCAAMYFKTAVVLLGLFASYVLLVFVASAWWQCLPLALAVALGIALVGFDIAHDGAHHAYSRHEWINGLAAMTSDLVGISWYYWHWKHNVFHHTYPNIDGEDTDIAVSSLARLSPHQKHRPIHRWQHIYLWFFYGLALFKRQVDDFLRLADRRMGPHAVPRPRRRSLVLFMLGKMTFLSLAFVIPMLFRPWWAVLFWYGAIACLTGVFAAVVFQLAHVVPAAHFPRPRADGQLADSWAAHQAATTVDFARKNRLLNCLLGGLNFQIEHHLFPRICHVNYPALSGIVESTCREFGVPYHEYPSLGAALVAHYQWLRMLGSDDSNQFAGCHGQPPE